MSIDSTTPRSRRALLGAGLAAIAATVAGALGRPTAATAAEPSVTLGQDNAALTPTTITTTDRIAIHGISGSDAGVVGSSTSSVGVWGIVNSAGSAVRGTSGATAGFTAGVWGDVSSPGGVGAFGRNLATTGLAIGAQGTSSSPTGLALVGWADAGGVAVIGFSGGPGFPAAPRKTGVHGRADQDGSSVGVNGSSANGRGGLFAGKLAQLRLVPSTATTHPSSGVRGDLFVDKSGRLWYCKGGTAWSQLA